MKNNLYKFLFIIGIVILTFFIKQNKVSATEYYNCDYSSPLTYVDDNNIPTNLQLGLKFNVPYSALGVINPGNLLPGVKFDWETKTSTNSVNSFCLNKDELFYNFGFKLNEPVDYNRTDRSAVTQINQYIINTYVSLDLDNNNSPYIMVYVKNGTLKAKNVGQSEYEQYLKNTQYKGMTASNRLYNLITLSNIVNDRYYSTDNCVYSCHVTGLGEFEDKENKIVNYIKKNGGIVFVKSDLKENYPNTNLTKYKQMLSLATDASNNKLSSEDQKNALNGLATVIDTNSQNNGSITKPYFDATRQKWNKYISSNLSSKKGEETRREYFSKWFSRSIARYDFEYDLNEFLMYWKYIYADDCSTTTCDLNGDGKNDSQDTKIYKNIISIIESMQNYTTADTCAVKIQNNPCISICTSSAGSCTGSAFDQCTSSLGSSDYKACLSCISSRCQNIGSGEAIKACYNQCTSDKYSDQVDHYEQSKQQASTTAAQSALSIYKIFKVSDPTLDISFDNPYKIKCEDVAIFHDFYVIFQIAAPILVILFGSIDYAKAVISSDIEKMEKSKKLFPKRVMMLVLFVIIPIIIKIILDLYSKASPDNAVGTDLMECIINGK